MNKQFTKIKIYELGGGVAFAEEAATVPFLVLPKGQATMKAWGASGFVFENVITGDVIAFVDTFDDVLDSAGAAYGVSQIAAMTAISLFFFELGGGGDAIDVTYDNAVSGLAATNVQDAIDEVVADISGNFILPIARKQNFLYPAQSNGIVQVADINFTAFAIYLWDAQSISNLTIEVTNAAAAGKRFVIGIYDNAGNLIDQTGELLADLVAVQSYTFAAPLALSKGMYYIGIMNNGANLFVRNMPASAFYPTWGYATTTGAALNRATRSTGYVYSATMPATIPTFDTFDNSNLPNVLLTLA